jgi:hypothetical protein
LHGISQRPAKPFETDLHDVAVFEADAFAKTEGVRSEEMDVKITRATVSFELEMVMFQILKTV